MDIPTNFKKCNICNYSSKFPVNLRRHVKAVHEGIQDHKCDQCLYKTAFKDALKRHVKHVHDKIRDNLCEKCDYKCYRCNKSGNGCRSRFGNLSRLGRRDTPSRGTAVGLDSEIYKKSFCRKTRFVQHCIHAVNSFPDYPTTNVS
jgi:hypothetical protein